MPSILFDSAIGDCLLEYSSDGITGLSLAPLAKVPQNAARVVPVDKNARRAIAEIRSHLAGLPFSYSHVKLDVPNGTPFREKIYSILKQTKPGQTYTYSQLAELAEKPGAARAVGTAMSSNRVPLMIPCHRVIGKRGLGGYSGGEGLPLKQWLLDLEAKKSSKD